MTILCIDSKLSSKKSWAARTQIEHKSVLVNKKSEPAEQCSASIGLFIHSKIAVESYTT